MTDCPKRSAVMNQEATDKLLDNKKQRSSAQVQQDKEIAATFAAMAEEKKVKCTMTQHKLLAKDIALKVPEDASKFALKVPEDALKSEEAESNSLESDGGSDEEQEQLVLEPESKIADLGPAEQDYISLEGLVDIPDESVVDTESSDGRGLGFEDQSDGDHDKDKDYVMDSDDGDKGSKSNSDGEFDLCEVHEAAKKLGKNPKKPKRGDFRKAINHARNNSAIAGNTATNFITKMKLPATHKRKQLDNKSVGPVVKKCAKKDEGGLLSGWSNKLAKQRLDTISAWNASSHELVEDQDPLEYAGGEFDEDKPVEVVRAARNMKKPAVTVRGNRTTTIRIFEPVPAETSSSGRRVKKVKYTFSSLLFPCGAANITYAREWRRSFKPTLIHWAATLEDPFGTNALMEDVITEVWGTIFPSIKNEVVGGSREAIVHVAGDAPTNWRSSMGKEGLHLVLQALKKAGVEQEDAPSVAEFYLKNYHFIYQNPDDNKGNKGAFLSPLVTACLAAHIKKTMNNVIQYGYPVGALAIATAVLKRSLELIKAGHVGLDGHDTFDDDTNAAKKRKVNRYTGYTDAVWGGKTCGWAASAGRLDDTKWGVILHAAVDKMDWTADEGDIEEGTSGVTFDPHSLIEI
ncbi:hypothetical protein BYT27DRAFT_7260895 [Phlegmacium glaucopus]|nr:hypothetical protein BYT27DRAFT_7260895 [Phlegmacium glaucopus]